MKKDIKIFLKHIFECIEYIESTQLQDSLIRRIEIIGEAVKNLPNSFKNEHPQVPWKGIAGMRDILIHNYFGVDLNLLWKVLTKDIPELKENLNDIYKELE